MATQTFLWGWALTALSEQQGRLVCGTASGSLFSFDPETGGFIPLSTEDSDLGKIVSLLWDTKRNTLWVGANIGLVRIETTKRTRFTESAGNPNGLPGNSIMDMSLDTQDHLRIGTSQGGLAVLDLTYYLGGKR